eukprot:COSAG01_NODE_2293_length_7967_cov_83.137646_3_plen_111_part_00
MRCVRHALRTAAPAAQQQQRRGGAVGAPRQEGGSPAPHTGPGVARATTFAIKRLLAPSISRAAAASQQQKQQYHQLAVVAHRLLTTVTGVWLSATAVALYHWCTLQPRLW